MDWKPSHTHYIYMVFPGVDPLVLDKVWVLTETFAALCVDMVFLQCEFSDEE